MSDLKTLLRTVARLERELAKAKTQRANGNGGSGDIDRGAYCTPKEWAGLVGRWDVDPFSNPRSHIVSARSCQLERGDNGLEPGPAGSYRVGRRVYRATARTKVWIQPPYEIVLEVLAHYGHTRFGALLRFDPSTKWFERLWSMSRLIALPRRERIEFEAPPGVEASKNPYPHAFYFANPADASPALLRRCVWWRT